MIKVGDRFELAEENIFGYVSNVFCGEDTELVSIVVEMDDGRWATVDMRLVERRTLH